MKKILNLIVLSVLCHSLIAQQNNSNRHVPLKINSSLIVDNIYNIKGGFEKGFATLGLFDFNIDYCPVSKGLLKNTSFYGHLLKTRGIGASENFIGDVQVASNIEGRASRFIYELYIKQQIKDFNLSFGLHDLNTEFMASEFAGNYINSSFGIFPAVSLNVPVSIFPVTSIGGIITYSKKSFDFATGFYNLNHDYLEEESFNINNHLFKKGLLGVLEIRYSISPDNKLDGQYKIGAYYKDCYSHQDNTKHEDCTTEKNHGVYFIGDQVLLSFPMNYQFGLFAQIGLAPREINYVTDYYGGGISIQSVDKKYFPEFIGLAVGSVGLSSLEAENDRNVINRETVIEISIKKVLFGRISIQPDLQYIINPSGIYNNALTGILRIQIELNN